jgi:hypothetical protein
LAKEAGDPGQRTPLVPHGRAPIARVTKQRGQVLWKQVRGDTFALDQSGVSEGCSLACRVAIHEHDGSTALREMYRHAHADYAGAEHHYVCVHREGSSYRLNLAKWAPSGKAAGVSAVLLAPGADAAAVDKHIIRPMVGAAILTSGFLRAGAEAALVDRQPAK